MKSSDICLLCWLKVGSRHSYKYGAFVFFFSSRRLNVLESVPAPENSDLLSKTGKQSLNKNIFNFNLLLQVYFWNFPFWKSDLRDFWEFFSSSPQCFCSIPRVFPMSTKNIFTKGFLQPPSFPYVFAVAPKIFLLKDFCGLRKIRTKPRKSGSLGATHSPTQAWEKKIVAHIRHIIKNESKGV